MTDVLDDQEMKEAQRDYLDFLDDDVSRAVLLSKSEEEAMCFALHHQQQQLKKLTKFVCIHKCVHCYRLENVALYGVFYKKNFY